MFILFLVLLLNFNAISPAIQGDHGFSLMLHYCFRLIVPFSHLARPLALFLFKGFLCYRIARSSKCTYWTSEFFHSHVLLFSHAETDFLVWYYNFLYQSNLSLHSKIKNVTSDSDYTDVQQMQQKYKPTQLSCCLLGQKLCNQVLSLVCVVFLMSC